ncbi:hypothetical protein DAD186_06950 [Dermabacter vaginalis]|uniref:Uncharacterized protein n=1 Tax=Dermabacter vaginalis TaxID=1630135 RepID=A0A1B0ZGV8_9MICO|nr:hypothetical protein DAD186_06950 [Dermabacter vaginalis]
MGCLPCRRGRGFYGARSAPVFFRSAAAVVWVSTAAIALGALIVTRFIALRHRRASK